MSKGHRGSPTPPPNPYRESMSIKLFIADDHAVFRSGLRALLEAEADFGGWPEKPGRARKTLSAMERQNVDVLLLDISMPGLPGPRVAQELLAKRPGLAIVVLTMHEDEYYLQELLRIGVRGYVLKKSTGTELVQAIRSAYRGDTYIDPALARIIVSPYVGKPQAPDKSPADVLTAREKGSLPIVGLRAYQYRSGGQALHLRSDGRNPPHPYHEQIGPEKPVPISSASPSITAC